MVVIALGIGDGLEASSEIAEEIEVPLAGRLELGE